MQLMQIEVNKNKYHYFFLGMQKYSFKKKITLLKFPSITKSGRNIFTDALITESW